MAGNAVVVRVIVEFVWRGGQLLSVDALEHNPEDPLRPRYRKLMHHRGGSRFFLDLFRRDIDDISGENYVGIRPLRLALPYVYLDSRVCQHTPVFWGRFALFGRIPVG